MRRISAITAGLALVISIPVVLSSPASAATISVTVNCGVGPAFNLNLSANNFLANTGDVISVTNSSSGSGTAGLTASSLSGVTAGTLPIQEGNTSTFTVTGTSGGSFILGDRGTGNCQMKTATVTFTGSGGGSSSSTSAVTQTGPAPVFQQFGKPATGTCADAASATLNWAGVGSGGWGESWAQWMNSGKGGTVCNRSLVYSLGQSKWILG